MHPLMSPQQLHALLQKPDSHLVIFDCSWHMPQSGRNAKAEFAAGHIPGARFFDFDQKICNAASPLPHMLPSQEQFGRDARALGVHKDSLIVCYDSLGIFTAPRGWWMFRAMGHTQVAVLDGGLPLWQEKNLPVETSGSAPAVPPTQGDFAARLQPHWIADRHTVLAATENPEVQILDARSKERFRGEAPEPRPQLEAGHIPGSEHLHYQLLLNGGTYKSKEDLENIFFHRVKPQQRLITTCGSGVTACILALGAVLAGYPGARVYDGSWSEWGQRGNGLPVAKG